MDQHVTPPDAEYTYDKDGRVISIRGKSNWTTKRYPISQSHFRGSLPASGRSQANACHPTLRDAIGRRTPRRLAATGLGTIIGCAALWVISSLLKSEKE